MDGWLRRISGRSDAEDAGNHHSSPEQGTYTGNGDSQATPFATPENAWTRRTKRVRLG